MKNYMRHQQAVPASGVAAQSASQLPPWRILIVDDDPYIHAINRAILADFTFAGRGLELFSAMSGAEAREVLRCQEHIAVAMIDVVMETDDAGLRLVEFIRHELRNPLMRLIIYTGQPGLAPEKTVLEHYDIDDYKEKSELDETKLYTTLRLALKVYQTLQTLNTQRRTLTKILDAAPELYHPQSIKNFFHDVLNRIVNLCNLPDNHLISTPKNGFVATTDGVREFTVHAESGYFAEGRGDPEIQAATRQACIDCLVANRDNPHSILRGPPLADNALLMRLHMDEYDAESKYHFIYLESVGCQFKTDQEVLGIMAYQCASAFKNLQLYLELKAAHQRSSQLLSMTEQARNIAESANSAKTIFLAKMSHELRTPLNAIIGYTSLIEEEAEDLGYDDLLPDLKKIQSAGLQLLRMISDILDITQIESKQIGLKFEQFVLPELIEEIEILMQPLVDKRHNRFEVIYRNSVAQICSDKDKLKQILLNLLHNANKFTSQGRFALDIEYQGAPSENIKLCETPSRESCSHCEASGVLVFTVSDTGIGIAADQLDSIFQLFTQIDKSSASDDGTTPGAGLGLAISHQLCQVMGGNLGVQSREGEGSVFTLRVPVNVMREM